MKTVQFYCEQCRKPVSQDTKICPFCGINFSAIKCPVCYFAGEPAFFSDGCPSCGYMGKAELTADKKKVQKKHKVFSGSFILKNRTLSKGFYRGSAVLLIIFLIFLIVFYLRI